MVWVSIAYAASWLTIFATGINLALSGWGFVPWIQISLLAMIVQAAIAAFFSSFRLADISRMATREVGKPSPQLQSRLRDPVVGASILAQVGIGIGIVFLMTTRPDVTTAVAAVSLGAVGGIVLSLPGWIRSRAAVSEQPPMSATPSNPPAVRLFMAFESAAFILASLTHFGVLMRGYEHQEAGAAEAIIALVLVVGLLAILVRTAWTRDIGVAAQGFALF